MFVLPSREFGRWKVNNLAVERKNFLGSPLPLAPEFFRNIRLLGRRPTLQQITENLIKKYGTHFLLSATLGGKVILMKQLKMYSVAAQLLQEKRHILLTLIHAHTYTKPVVEGHNGIFCFIKV